MTVRRLPLAARLAGVVESPPPAVVPAAGGLVATRPLSVVRLIDEVLAERDREPPGYFRPSMVGGCARAQAFHYLRAPSHAPLLGSRMHRILDTGTAVHAVVQGYLADHPRLFFAPEARVWIPDLAVRGSCDGVLIDRGTWAAQMLEVKTIRSQDFEGLTAPVPKHVLQATTYATGLGLEWITFLYWCKNSQHLKEYAVRRDDAAFEAKVAAPLRALKALVDRGELPPFDVATCKDSIKFCRWTRHCYGLLKKPLPREYAA